MKSWEISRRACLRGGGAAIGLPVLEAMLPGIKRARAAGATSPKRLVCFVFTGGIPDCTYETTGTGNSGTNPGPGSFWPKTLGTNYETTRILQPCADAGLKQDILIIRNLHNAKGEMYDMRGGHGSAPNSLLTGEEPFFPGYPEVGDNPTRVGTSVDQIAANDFKQATPSLPSLYLGNPVPGDSQGQLMCWKNPTTRASYINQPSAAFRAVFGDNTVDAKTLQRRIAYKHSVLHHAKAAADRLKRKLGQADLQRLDAYLESVSDLEKRVMGAENLTGCATPGTPPPDTKLENNAKDDSYEEQAYHRSQIDLPTHFQNMSEVIVHAFQCDRTRVAVVHMFTHSLRFSWLPAPYNQYADWHGDVEHGAGEIPTEPNRAETYIRGCASLVAPFAYLCKRLKETKEGDGNGTLLDNSALMCTSELSTGSGHNMRHLPVIVAGGAGGLVKKGQGRYLVVEPGGELPIANLYVTMLNAVGVKDASGREITSFGNSTGALSLG